MNLLVTGAAGFIGSDFVRLMLSRSGMSKIVVLDALTYAGNRETMADFMPEIDFVEGFVQDAALVERVFSEHKISHVVNFAAETHNDRSIVNPTRFLESNILGVQVLANQVMASGCEKFVHVSTDEVYGSILSGKFTEDSPIQPNTPYSASKASGDLLCRAYFHTYKAPICITRGGNTFGPFQYPEKLIPFFVTRLIDNKKVPLYGDGSQIREWIFVRDHARGIAQVLESGIPGEAYNIGDDNEMSNLAITKTLLNELGKGEELIKQIPDPRKGAHDTRYSMDTTKSKALGWNPESDFAENLAKTVRWYVDNQDWWRALIARPEHQEFIRKFYGPGLGDDL